MKLFRFAEDEIIPNDQYSSVVYVNLDCITHLQEIRYKPRADGQSRHEDLWHVHSGDLVQSINVTQAGFERLKQAMIESD